MCGRIALPEDYKEITERDVQIIMPARPRYNVASTTPIPAIAVREGERTLDTYRWGIIPFWSKDGKLDLFNARDDKVATSSLYKGPLSRSRCIVPAAYFYGWQKRPAGAKSRTRSIAAMAARCSSRASGPWARTPSTAGRSKIG